MDEGFPMGSYVELTGKTRYRSLRRGIWPFNSTKLVLQVEEKHRIEFIPDFKRRGQDRIQARETFVWRDASFHDLTTSECRELFCRENPR